MTQKETNIHEKNWHVLDIDSSNAIQPGFDFDQLLESSEYLGNHGWTQWYYSEDQLVEVFTNSWLEYMKSIELEIQHAYIFCRSSNHIVPEAHIDTAPNDNFSFALNWVIGEDISPMVWYKMPDFPPELEYMSPTGKIYYAWPSHKLEELDRHILGSKITLVRVDIPHDILTNTKRICIGVRTKRKSTDWNNIVDQLKHLIIE